MSDFRYVGDELELFAQARNWKSYFGGFLGAYVSGRVLDVGAGLGATAEMLAGAGEEKWVCLEPDARLADRLRARIHARELAPTCEVLHGTLEDMDEQAGFDTLLYIDVLEHIEDDSGELLRAAKVLNPGGHLVVVAPAHQALFSRFDQAIGHHRRYNRASLRAVAPANMSEERTFYLDAAGQLLSVANRVLLRQRMPTTRQISFWDRRVIPVSRLVDRLAGFNLGKTLVGVWRR